MDVGTFRPDTVYTITIASTPARVFEALTPFGVKIAG